MIWAIFSKSMSIDFYAFWKLICEQFFAIFYGQFSSFISNSLVILDEMSVTL